MEIKFSDITVVVQGAVYEGITAWALVKRTEPAAGAGASNAKDATAEAKRTAATAASPAKE